MALHAFDHDDGIIDDEADRQHQSEERKRVDGETEEREEDESSDQGDGHGQEWNQGGTPALQEQVDDENDQGERDDECLDDFLDAFRDRKSGIERNREVHVVGEALFHLRHQLLDPGSGIDRVRAG